MQDSTKILLIDDDVRLLDAVQIYLSRQQWRVSTASNGPDALDRYRDEPADLIVLDIMMPGMDGWELCEHLRLITDVPIMILTARGQEYDRVKGLELGADDYLVKPFSLRVLEARIAGFLRRSQEFATAWQDIHYDDGTLLIDGPRRYVASQGKSVNLTNTEQRLLFLLAEHFDQTLPVAAILSRIWGLEDTSQTDYVGIYINRLRQKIEPHPEQPTYLVNAGGDSYRLVRLQA